MKPDKKHLPAKADKKHLPAKKGDVASLLEQYAVEDSAREIAGSGGPQISIKGSRFTLGGELLGDEIRVVVLDFVHAKAFYDSGFDPDSPQPPACFAVSEDGKDMVPHDTAPAQQNDQCSGCANNEFGTAERGKGKACKDMRKLAVIHADDLDDLDEATIAFINLPPASIGPWSSYSKGLMNRMKRPVFGVITKLSFDQSTEFPKVLAELDEEINDKTLLTALIAKRETVREVLMTPPDASGYVAPDDRPTKPAKKGGAKPGSKFAKR